MSGLREVSRTTPSLVIVTVCRDNPEAVKVTLASVARQTLPPNRHLVIDGSNHSNRELIARYASHFGAEYVWSTPKGIYDAMRVGLGLCNDLDVVWFVNATDRLATPDSVERAIRAIKNLPHHESNSWWIVGRTAIIHRRLPHLLSFPTTSHNWVDALRRGKVGLPHQSMLAPVSALRAVHAFEPPSPFAEDYRIGLALIARRFLPTPVDDVLSVYDQSGVSGRFSGKTVLSKSVVRTKIWGLQTLFLEPVRLFEALVRATLRRLWGLTGSATLFRLLGWSKVDGYIGVTSHFCANSEGQWPQCCADYLLKVEVH